MGAGVGVVVEGSTLSAWLCVVDSEDAARYDQETAVFRDYQVEAEARFRAHQRELRKEVRQGRGWGLPLKMWLAVLAP